MALRDITPKECGRAPASFALGGSANHMSRIDE